LTIQPELEKAEEELALLEQNEKVLNNILITLKKNIENKEENRYLFFTSTNHWNRFPKITELNIRKLTKIIMEKQTLYITIPLIAVK
jgi:hypothetical protein